MGCIKCYQYEIFVFWMSFLESLPDISNWNTNNVINMNGMFKSCKSLKSLPDISKWNIEKVEDKKNMFTDCSKSLIIPKIFI